MVGYISGGVEDRNGGTESLDSFHVGQCYIILVMVLDATFHKAYERGLLGNVL